MEILVSLLFIFGFIAIYFMPFIIAVNRKHKNRVSIFLVNLLFGWSFIGWAVALIWSFTSNTESVS